MNQTETNRDDQMSSGGNTKSPLDANKQANQFIYWSFTHNNYNKELIEIILQVLSFEVDWLIMQEEVGDSGNKHLQGTCKLLKRRRRTELVRLIHGIHWEPTIAVTASVVYCSRLDKRYGDIWTIKFKIPEIIVNDFKPYGWQLEVMDIIAQPPHPRIINWFWEPDGGVGKSELALYLYDHHNAMVCMGKASDIFHVISKNEKKRGLFIFDITKEKMEHFSYTTIEQLKNGLFMSGKYDSNIIRIHPRPHIIIFANSPPDYHKLTTKARWNVIKIQLPESDHKTLHSRSESTDNLCQQLNSL